MTQKKSGLGKGLSALFSAYEDYDKTAKSKTESTNEIEITKLKPNPN